MSRSLLFVLLSIVLCSAQAQTLLKKLPEPDLSTLPAAQADNLRTQRAEFEEARTTLVGPPLAAAYGLIGGIYARNGVFAPAQVAFENAISLVPDDFRMVYLAGLVAMLGEDLVGAQRYFERALDIEPDYPATRVHLAEVLVRQGQQAQAVRRYRELIDAGENTATAYAKLGQLALEQRRFDEARDHFAAAIASDPQATSLYHQLAATERARGRSAEAAAFEARAGDGLLTLVDPLGRALFGPPAGPFDAVLQMIAQGELESARTRLQEMLQNAPDNALGLGLLARVEAGLGRIEPARDAILRALQSGSNEAAVQVAAGVVEEMAGEEARAVEHYTRALAANPADGEALMLLGDALMRQRRYAQAAEHYRALGAGDGERARGLPRLVAAEVMAGRCAEALAAARASREKQPRDGVRAEVWARLAATCPAASETDREQAAEIADAIYQQLPDARSSETAAMTLAALGRWDDAVDLQRQALFELARNDDQAAIARSRTLLERFMAEQPAEKPWPDGHPLYAPAPLRPARP